MTPWNGVLSCRLEWIETWIIKGEKVNYCYQSSNKTRIRIRIRIVTKASKLLLA